MRKQLLNPLDESWIWGEGDYAPRGLSSVTPLEDDLQSGGLDLRLEGLRVGEDWERCGHRVTEILCALESDGGSWIQQRGYEKLKGTLFSLKGAIRQHFRSVESGPLYREFLEEFPEYSNHLERLRSERRKIVEQVDRVLDELRPGAQVPENLRARIRGILDDIQTVSKAEGDFLWEAHYVDTPALD